MSLITSYFTKNGRKPSEVLTEEVRESVPSLTTRESSAVKESLRVHESRKRGRYTKWTKEQKREIGEYAVKHGASKAAKDLQNKYSGLTKQSVHDFKKFVMGGEPQAKKKVGRPSLLPEDLMTKTIEVVQALRINGAPMTGGVITSVAIGLVNATDRSILVENGGWLSLNRQWGRNILYRMKKDGQEMSRRIGTTCKLPVAPGLLAEMKLNFQREIRRLVDWHDIPEDLILNFDQTPLSYVSAPNHTLHVKGASSVPLVGKGKKKQITGTFTVSMTGEFLGPQLIYGGKTNKCHPSIDFPPEFNVTHSPNHWSNEDRVIEHLEQIVFPYLLSKKVELGLGEHQKSLLIFDVFKAQITDRVEELLDANNCVYVLVPANMTHHFQPLDITINGMAKKFLNAKFSDWYSGQITQQLKDGVPAHNVKIDLTLTKMKPVHARWLIGLYDYLRNQREVIIESFTKAGITEALKMVMPSDDPFSDLV